MRGHWAVLLDAALRAGFAENLLEPINASRISIDGGMASGPGVDQNLLRRKVGMVFQSFNLFPHQSVEENFMTGPMHLLGGKPLGRPRSSQRLTGSRVTRPPRNMFRRSGVGCQQRRVAIAMHPKALLLGEITSAPDPELAVEVLNVVRDLAQDGDDVFGHARDAITPRSV